eukprot:gene3758-252_t
MRYDEHRQTRGALGYAAALTAGGVPRTLLRFLREGAHPQLRREAGAALVAETEGALEALLSLCDMPQPDAPSGPEEMMRHLMTGGMMDVMNEMGRMMTNAMGYSPQFAVVALMKSGQDAPEGTTVARLDVGTQFGELVDTVRVLSAAARHAAASRPRLAAALAEQLPPPGVAQLLR